MLEIKVLYKHLKILKMLYFLFGVIAGIWLDQTFTLPSVQDYIEQGIKKIKQNQKENTD